jgi:hypothetical protein
MHGCNGTHGFFAILVAGMDISAFVHHFPCASATRINVSIMFGNGSIYFDGYTKPDVNSTISYIHVMLTCSALYSFATSQHMET